MMNESLDDLALDTEAPESGTERLTGTVADLNPSHRLTQHLMRLMTAPPTARIAMAVGELASAMDHAAGDDAFAVAISAVKSGHKMGFTALTLAALWGRWGRPTCLIELGTGDTSLGGAIRSTIPDLVSACDRATAGQRVTGISSLHSQLPTTGVIVASQSDVLQLVSRGGLKRLIGSLKKDFERIVVAAPSMESAFPVLSLNSICDRLVISLVAGESRAAPLRELAKHALLQGMPPVEAIWHD